MYTNEKNIVKISNEESKEFTTRIIVKEGCIFSPLLFTLILDNAIIEA